VCPSDCGGTKGNTVLGRVWGGVETEERRSSAEGRERRHSRSYPAS